MNILLEGSQSKAQELQKFFDENPLSTYTLNVEAGANDFWARALELNDQALLVATRESKLSLSDWPVLLQQLDTQEWGQAVEMVLAPDFHQHSKLYWPSQRGRELKELNADEWGDYADALVSSGISFFPAQTLNSAPQLPLTKGRPLFCAESKKESALRRALFLDRDGVVIKDAGYHVEPSKCELIPETVELIKQARSKNYLVIVLTNQSGVARGYFEEEQVQKLHEWLGQKMSAQGAKVDLWLSSFFHFEKGLGVYQKHSLTRKPGPGLALKALEYWPIDFSHSLMVGDKTSDDLDIACLKTLHLLGDYDLSQAKGQVIHSAQEALKLL